MNPKTPNLDALVAESAYPPLHNPLLANGGLEQLRFDGTLTKRERFAKAAMQGFCASPDVQNPSISGIAKSSVMQADALIAALKSIPEPS
jgi:hypothetical protein